MKLIIGLGNPGKEYQNTRHNVGQMVVQKILASLNLSLQSYSKLSAELVQIGAGLPAGRQGSQDKIFLGITTGYMNNSGMAVKKVADYFKIEPQDIYIIHDDLDLPVGEWKLQFDRGPAGHNGVKSTIDHLGTRAFWRYRIGINHPRNTSNPNLPVEEYVVLPFNQDEKQIIEETIDKIVPEIIDFIQGH